MGAKERRKIREICDTHLVPLGRKRKRLIKRQQLINQPAVAEFVSRLCEFPEYAERAQKRKGLLEIYSEAKKLRNAVLKFVGRDEFKPIYGQLCSAARRGERREALAEFKMIFTDCFDPSNLTKSKSRKNGFIPTKIHVEVATALCSSAMADRMALTVFDEERDRIEEEMQALVEELHVYDWWMSIRGCGAQSLASVIAETGDLFKYANPGKVWKRLGLAPVTKLVKGELVTKACSTWKRQKGSLTNEEWTKAGYNPQRRSAIFAAVGQVLVMQQDEASREIYLAKKEEMAAREPDWKKAHVNMYAIRYMEKKLIRKLWRRWWAMK